MVYHKRYEEVYSRDPAAEAGRMKSISDVLRLQFEFVEPISADEEDLRLVHTSGHISSIKKLRLYENSLLAVGGALRASEIAMDGEPSFGLIRPPGHHSSSSGCWGFCFFNNIAISVEKLRETGKIKNCCIVDIDLHYGDGTANIFASRPEVSYYHLSGGGRGEQLENLAEYLSLGKRCDMLAVSAGFDRHEEDWGGTLKTEDYEEIGKMLKDYAERECDGKRYAVLEGGYNHHVLGRNVRAFLEGMK